MPEYVQSPTLASLEVIIQPELKSQFIDWQAKLNSIITGHPGFVSLEFLSTPNRQCSWMIVQRFYDIESLKIWIKSAEYLELIKELKSLVAVNGFKEIIEDESSLRSGVTEVIITQVSPDKEKYFQEWSAKIHQVEATFAGFRGVYIQSPKQSKGDHWITLLQFDTPENLDKWLQSTERQNVLKESNALISSLESHRVASPYAGWFYSIAKTQEIPSVWKQTMIVLLLLFPLIMLELKFLSPLTSGLNPSLQTFIGNSLSVVLLAFPLMPIVINLLGWWLFPQNKVLQYTILGTIAIFLMYGIEILFFWNFL